MAMKFEVMPVADEDKVSPLRYFIDGGVGGISYVFTFHPLDTLKVRLQTMPTVGVGETPLYSGIIDCGIKTIRQEGPLALYKGVSAPLLSIAPMCALSFFSYGIGQRMVQSMSSNKNKLSYTQYFMAGAFSGLVSSVITGPAEHIKCLLQVQTGDAKYKGFFDTAAKLYNDGGIVHLYKGTCATLLRDIPAFGCYFLTYELLMNVLSGEREVRKVNAFNTMLAGGIAGMSLWLFGMPPDVLKSRYQIAPKGYYEHGIRSVYRELMINEGWRALFRGILPVMVLSFPPNAACFLGVELSKYCFATYMPNIQL